MDLQLATRPQRAATNLGRPQKVFSNFFNLQFNSAEIKGIQKYHVKFTPEVPDNSGALKKAILRKMREQIKEKTAFYIFWGNCLFSYVQAEPFTLTAEEQDVTYTCEFVWVQTMEPTDKDHLGFLKIFFNSMMRSLRFETIGPKSFNPKAAKKLPAHNIQVWPGFDPRLIMKEHGVMLNIDVCFKVLRNDSALTHLNKLKEEAERRGGDWQKNLQEAVAGMTIVTRYNQRSYRVERVDFEQTPLSTFQKGEETVSFKDYFQTQYKETISDLQQPLFVHKDRKTGRESYLMPELCTLTGLTDAMRADFRLMKDLAQITHTDAQRKIAECKNLFEVFKQNPKCQKKMEEWKLEFKQEPNSLEGFKFSPGNLIMGTKDNGQRNMFDIERTGREIDRKIQDRMYTQPDLKMWAIFYSDRDQQVAKQFESTMNQCLQQFGYKGNPARMFPVAQGNRADSWAKEVKDKIRPGVQTAVLLLPGQKGKCTLYDDIKRLFLSEIPVPSQVVLAGTISKGKNVRSIVSKILIQINAKVGGIPWAVDALPLMQDKPTMICGMDVYHQTALGNKSVLGFVASVDPTATQYWSTSHLHESGQEMGQTLNSVACKAAKNFERINGALPARIVIYRDGVSSGQLVPVCQSEIQQVKAGLTAAGCGEAELMFINVNKRVNTKLFSGDVGNYKNPQPGLVVDQGITDKEEYSFYMVSTTARQGMVTPTHFTIVYDSVKCAPDQIELLTYKLCHTYYNMSGSIKVPACVQYAHRLAALVGDRGTRNNPPPELHKRYEEELSTLFFI